MECERVVEQSAETRIQANTTVEMHDFILIVLTNRNYQTKSKTHEEIED